MGNCAFIDGANLHKGIGELGWKLDYKRFRIFLAEKYRTQTAYLFLGMLRSNTGLYRDLQVWGYTLIFKPMTTGGYGEIKGNCDAELVLQAVSGVYEKKYENAVIVSGDGDFRCLVDFLIQKDAFGGVISPNEMKASALLKKIARQRIVFLDKYRSRLEYRPK